FGAAEFLYKNDADQMLFRGRMAASAFTVFLAVCVFIAANRFFGLGAAVVALTLVVFEPNVLAHGALVTTDMAVSCGIFAAVLALSRHTERPSAVRLVVCGLAAGLALISKHSGMLVLPILVLLASGQILLDRGSGGLGKRAFRLAAGLMAIGLMCLALMWAVYGFRYHARPGARRMSPSLAEFAPPDSPHPPFILPITPHPLL